MSGPGIPVLQGREDVKMAEESGFLIYRKAL